jgi:hypothetical protein
VDSKDAQGVRLESGKDREVTWDYTKDADEPNKKIRPEKLREKNRLGRIFGKVFAAEFSFSILPQK